ncbi:MAG: hypothetical protein K2K91_05025 [Ruminococcus sp.]|nr:hypothetical protein [Ruminococcus sp.]
MKNIMKKIIAVFAVLCVTATTFASCGDKPNNNSSTSNSNSSLEASDIDETLKRYPLSVGGAGDGNQIAAEGEADLNADDPVETTTAKEDTTKATETEVQDVTDSNNQPVTEVVEVTKADGSKETDANNNPVTETVKVTTVVTKTTEAVKTESKENSDYKSKNDGRYAMWMDVSNDENFMFEGDMLNVKFKVKEGIPDGDYKIRISPDLADVAGVSVKPGKVIDGIIRVNNGDIQAADVSGETGLTFYGDNIACKQGDEIEFKINVKNNPGLVAFCIWFYFDSNALDFIEADACGEFKPIAEETAVDSGGGLKD